VVSQGLARRLGGALALLLIVSTWRPAPASAYSPNLQGSHKRIRRCPAELPETGARGSRKLETTSRERGLLLSAKSEPPAGCPEACCSTASNKVSAWRSRPRYLQASYTRDSQSILAPPLW